MMKYIIAFFFLSLTVACTEQMTTASTLNTSMYDSPLIDREVALNNPYELTFDIEKGKDGQYSIVANMKLYGGSFYVSPHSTTEFKGRFTVELAFYDHLAIGDDFVETPRSKEVIDPHPFVNGPVNWVQEDTRYEYPLIVNSQEDFDVGGKIYFTIEPKCTLEEIPFMIKYRSGVLSIEDWKC
jgi:hypothetical protein